MRKGLTHSFLSAALISLTTGAFAQTLSYPESNNLKFTKTVQKTVTSTITPLEKSPYYVKNVVTGLSSPLGLNYKSGFFYVAQDGIATAFNGVDKIDATAWTKEVLAGKNAHGSADGTGANATFDGPTGVCFDHSGNFLLLADAAWGGANNGAIRKINLSTKEVTTLIKHSANTTTPTEAAGVISYELGNVHDIIAIPGTSAYYISNRTKHTILKFDPTKTTVAEKLTIVAGVHGVNTTLNAPTGLTLDDDNNLYFVESSGKKIRKLTPNGTLSTLAMPTDKYLLNGTTYENALPNTAFGITYVNGKLYVTDQASDHVVELKLNTAKTEFDGAAIVIAGGKIGAANIENIGNSAEFNQLFDVKYLNGDLYMVDKGSGTLKKLNLGSYTISPSNLPTGLTFNTMTGEISGTATNEAAAASYTVSSLDGNGTLIASQNITIEVLASLPVSLTSFEAKKQTNGSVNVTWTTASEKDNSHFTLAKSTDGTNFATLATKNALGNQGGTYNHVDTKIAAGANYYKLQQVDVDGTTTDLGIKVVQGGVTTASWAVYPNPSKGTDLNIQYTGSSANKLVKVYNLAGQQVFAKKVSLNGATKIAFASKLAAGIYTIQIEGLGAQKFIVE